MKKMMFLTLALSVMAMGSAMANDSTMAKNDKPRKVKIEINNNCCGDHDYHRFECETSHKYRKPVKHNHKYVKGPKLGCPACAPKHFGKPGHKPGRGFEGKRPGGRPDANRGNGRPGGRF